MILTKLVFNYLIGLLFGFYTGFNKYKLLFMLIVFILLDLLLISSSVAVVGSSVTSQAIGEQLFKWSGLLTFISMTGGAVMGIWLKVKSKKWEDLN